MTAHFEEPDLRPLSLPYAVKSEKSFFTKYLQYIVYKTRFVHIKIEGVAFFLIYAQTGIFMAKLRKITVC